MTREDERRPAQILVVEDDPGELRLLLEALRSGPATKNISVAKDGEEALAFLRQEGRHAGSPRPDLVIMPMSMPRGDGRQVIAAIKSDPRLRRIPIVVLTSSQSEQDVDQAYELHANCYVVKPVEMDRFFSVVRAIEDFWLCVSVPPPDESTV